MRNPSWTPPFPGRSCQIPPTGAFSPSSSTARSGCGAAWTGSSPNSTGGTRPHWKPAVLNILRTGLYQLLFTDRIPPFAAVNEAVGIARDLAPAAAGLVNAILRNCPPEKGRHRLARYGKGPREGDRRSPFPSPAGSSGACSPATAWKKPSPSAGRTTPSRPLRSA